MKQLIILPAMIGALAVAGCGQKSTKSNDNERPRTAREQLEQQDDRGRSGLEGVNRDLAGKVRKLEQDAEIQGIELEGMAVRVLVDGEAVMQELTMLAPDRATRTRDMRRVLFLLECLANVGPSALPSIEGFLIKNKDIEYGFTGSMYAYNYNRAKPAGKDAEKKKAGQNKNVNWSSNGRYNYTLNTEFIFPPSLRRGLFEVLARIGGEESEAILLATLKSTGRGLEVASLDKLLSDFSGDAHRDDVLNVTHDLLADPPDISEPSQIDRYHRKYLFGLLTKYRDETFAEVAKHLIVRDDGKVDTEVVNYLNRILGERAIPLLAAAINDERLDKRYVSSLSYYVLRHVGQHPGAEAMFREIMRNDELASLRRTAISQLAYNSGSKDALRKKLELLNAYEEKLSADPKVAPTLKWMKQRIERQLDPNYKPRTYQFKSNGQGYQLRRGSGGGQSLIFPQGGGFVPMLGGEERVRVIRSTGGGVAEVIIRQATGVRDSSLSIRLERLEGKK